MELLDMAGNPFTQEDFMAGKKFRRSFGSAMNNFGIEPFLQRFLTSLCPSPRPRKTQDGSLPAGTTLSSRVLFLRFKRIWIQGIVIALLS